jgi:hypothetical protein
MSYKIMVNGVWHGTYPTLQYATNALEGLNKPREKNSYNWQLIGPNGEVQKSGITPTKKSSFIKKD